MTSMIVRRLDLIALLLVLPFTSALWMAGRPDDAVLVALVWLAFATPFLIERRNSRLTLAAEIREAMAAHPSAQRTR